ncbi:hypothetical protein H0H93_016065 [Arthromyces matolae]|nr:hypothetical protein H0H93_016065 [Arthromyces matolae]
MSDLSVYITVINKTAETLANGTETHPHSQWVNFPTLISPGTTSFQLKDSNQRWVGSSGTFSYDIIDPQERSRKVTTFETSFSDPYRDPNSVAITNNKLPPVYAASYRASVKDNKHWKDNAVDGAGYPVYVEFTLDYARKKHYKFKLMKITAVSAHPIRNTRNPTQLIVGDHVLWNTVDSASYKDGKLGSFQPNVFAYDFGTSVAASGTLSVTVQPRNVELSYAEAIITGTIGSTKVFQSDFFFFKGPNQDVTATVHVVDPTTKDTPFSINGDVDWSVQLRPASSGESLDAEGEFTTRLELYWVAKTLHRALENYMPVNFLRLALKSDYQPKASTAVADRDLFHARMVLEVYYEWNKYYDTMGGEGLFARNTHFNVWNWGGDFWLTRYSAPDAQGRPGGNERIVNCTDQAAMLELSCGLNAKTTSWLVLQPYGYINTTHLVGWINAANVPYNVNNPFFQENVNRALVAVNDPYRTSFGYHAFNAERRTWTSNSNWGIYDACAGPHEGTENYTEYVRNAIDVSPQVHVHIEPGHPVKAVGIQAIDGAPIHPQGHNNHVFIESEQQTKLFDTIVASAEHPTRYTNWTGLSTWFHDALGAGWVVEISDVTVGKDTTQAFFKISDSNNHDDAIEIDVNAFSPINEHGQLDREGYSDATRGHVHNVVTSTQIADTWILGDVPNHGSCLKNADHVPAGRILLVSGHTVIEIRGFKSTESLLPLAQRLLDRASHHDVPAPQPIVPKLGQKISTKLTP